MSLATPSIVAIQLERILQAEHAALYHWISSTKIRLASSKLLSTYSQPFTTFNGQLSSFLTHVSTTPFEFILTGDFNIHIDDPADQQSIIFMLMPLQANFNHTQHVFIPKHTHGHTLDLVITIANFTQSYHISRRQHNLWQTSNFLSMSYFA